MGFLKKYANSIGDIVGDENTVIQIIDQSGHPITAKLGKLLEHVLEKKQEELILFKKLIADKEKITNYQEKELFELKSELANKVKTLENKEQQLAKVYLELNGKDLSVTPKLYAKAYTHFLEGDVKKALSTLDRQKMIEEKDKLIAKNVEHAEVWMFKARLFQSVQEYEKVGECFDFAIELHPSWENCLEAANYFTFYNKFSKAENLYSFCLIKATNNKKNASTLNNLAVLLSKQKKVLKAEKTYIEALDLYRKLARFNPKSYLPDLATTLNNFANLLKTKDEFPKAKKAYIEALDIHQKFTKSNPQTFLPLLATTLNNLASLESEIGNFHEAEKAYTKALKIRKQLAHINPQIFLPNVADTLNNLANLLKAKDEFPEAEKAYMEALDIYQQLTNSNPQTYLPYFANTLNNLAVLQSEKKEFSKAEKNYLKALAIRRKLVEQFGNAYQIVLAQTLYNIGYFLIDQNEESKAIEAMKEVVEILTPLSVTITSIKFYLEDAIQKIQEWSTRI